MTSFEIYVSDITGRRFEKVKNGHIFETGRRCASYMYLPRDSNEMRFNALNKMNQIIGEVGTHKHRLTLPLFIEVPVPGQESEESCID